MRSEDRMEATAAADTIRWIDAELTKSERALARLSKLFDEVEERNRQRLRRRESRQELNTLLTAQ